MPLATQPIIQLRFSDKSQKVLIEADAADTCEKEGRFVMTVAAAIDACKASGKREEFFRQFKDMQGRITNWIREHEKEIDVAYLTVRDSAILFLVVQKGAAFCQELEDSLTDLDISIAQDDDLNLIRLNMLALPKSSEHSIDSFLVCGGANL